MVWCRRASVTPLSFQLFFFLSEIVQPFLPGEIASDEVTGDEAEDEPAGQDEDPDHDLIQTIISRPRPLGARRPESTRRPRLVRRLLAVLTVGP